MGVDTVIEDDRWSALGIDVLAERAADATLARLGLDPAVCEIACLACDDTRIAELNASFNPNGML